VALLTEGISPLPRCRFRLTVSQRGRLNAAIQMYGTNTPEDGFTNGKIRVETSASHDSTDWYIRQNWTKAAPLPRNLKS